MCAFAVFKFDVYKLVVIAVAACASLALAQHPGLCSRCLTGHLGQAERGAVCVYLDRIQPFLELGLSVMYIMQTVCSFHKRNECNCVFITWIKDGSDRPLGPSPLWCLDRSCHLRSSPSITVAFPCCAFLVSGILKCNCHYVVNFFLTLQEILRFRSVMKSSSGPSCLLTNAEVFSFWLKSPFHDKTSFVPRVCVIWLCSLPFSLLHLKRLLEKEAAVLGFLRPLVFILSPVYSLEW